MTGKRFTIEEKCRIRDNTTSHLMNIANNVDTKIVCDLLNELHEENQQLKQEIKELDTFKKILEYAEKDNEERADWQAYCEKEFEGL